MENLPPVSVIIPVYNSEKFLNSALESIFYQSYSSELQVIVIDDGSTDRTSFIAKGYCDVEYLYQKNRGVSAARNVGLELAKGSFIAFLDADDIWKPEKLEEQVSYMEQNPGIGITGTYAENFLESGTELPLRIKAKSDWQKLEDHIIPSTMMVRASVFKDIGVFDTRMTSGEDTEWLWRAKQAEIEEYIIKKPLVRRRFHGANLSWKHAEDKNKRLLWIARQTIRRKSGRK